MYSFLRKVVVKRGSNMSINIRRILGFGGASGSPMGLQEASGGFRRAQEAQPKGGGTCQKVSIDKIIAAVKRKRASQPASRFELPDVDLEIQHELKRCTGRVLGVLGVPK